MNYVNRKTLNTMLKKFENEIGELTAEILIYDIAKDSA